MKIFKIVCLMLLWLCLFGAGAAAFFLHPDMGWGLAIATLFGIIIMIAASMFINEAFE